MWLDVGDTRHVAVNSKDVGAGLRNETKQFSVHGNVRAGDWRFDFRRRNQFERERLLRLLERKTENLGARIVENL